MKPKTVAAFILLTMVLFGLHSRQGLGANFEKIWRGIRAPVDRSVLLVRVRDNKVLFKRQSERALIPASVTKLVTAATALAHYPPNHTFKTGLWHTGRVKNGKVFGDLILVGDGDPFLVSEKIWQMAIDLKHLGFREFNGNIVIDNTLFGGASRDESRKSGARSSRYAYDAPVSAFGVNFNTLAVAIAPAAVVGGTARIGVDPYNLLGVDIVNRVRTSVKNRSAKVALKRVTNRGDERLVATGSVSIDSELEKKYRSVQDHVRVSGEIVRAFLKAEGIKVAGKVIESTKPTLSISQTTSGGAKKILDIPSFEMRRIVRGLNVFSNNYIADVLVKRLGASVGPNAGKPGSGTMANGVRLMKEFMQKDVGAGPGVILENGSGLDTDNRLSARHVVRMLMHVESRFDLFPEFVASLPVSGMDGTMRKRFSKDPATKHLSGLVRAKTGTLTEPVSVAALAGYLRHPKHGLLAFCMIENGRLGKPQPAIVDLRDRQDKLISAWMKQL